jgi:acyl-coenzyme A synthetase/AMP-(fatty) acid ligase
MLARELSRVIESAACSGNVLADGNHTCTYRELPEIVAALDLFFSDHPCDSAGCYIFFCGNSLPEALVLLWLLFRKRDVLLLPRGGMEINLPHFCRCQLKVKPEAPALDLYKPATFLEIETNPAFTPGLTVPGHGPGLLLRTSGSTAQPKLALHHYEKFLGNALNCVGRFELHYRDRILIPVPLYHMYGLGAAFIPAVLAGASISLLAHTNILRYLDRERQFQPTVAFLTPILCEMLIQIRKTSYQYRLSVTAGDRITPATFARFEHQFGTLINLYGSTELGAIATSVPGDPLELRSQGIVATMPGMSLEFPGSPKATPPDRVSEIYCRHDFGFDAYVDKKGEKNNRERIQPFKTNDLGIPVDGQRCKVVGRIGNSINRSGILVAFSEVETLMEQGIEEIAHTVVTGSEQESSRGKTMTAWCQLKPGQAITPRELRSRCFKLLLRHMVPDEIMILKEIPRLPNGKFDRNKLKLNK